MATYEGLYRQIGMATDMSSNFFNVEIFEMVKKEADEIGRKNLENRSIDNWAIAKSNLASSIDLALSLEREKVKYDLSDEESGNEYKEFVEMFGVQEYIEYIKLGKMLFKESEKLMEV